MTTTQTTKAPGTVTLAATYALDGLTVTRSVVAGVTGPCLSLDSEQVPNLDAADRELGEQGYTRTSPWTPVKSYEGMWLTAQLAVR